MVFSCSDALQHNDFMRAYNIVFSCSDALKHNVFMRAYHMMFSCSDALQHNAFMRAYNMVFSCFHALLSDVDCCLYFPFSLGSFIISRRCTEILFTTSTHSSLRCLPLNVCSR